jgi:alpha-tubulin suppressor-like RCC1 family protein
LDGIKVEAMKASRNFIPIWLLFVLMLQVLTSGAQPVTKIAAGGHHSLFLKSDGSLWAMGDNTYSQLGDGTTDNVNCPEQIVASNVTAIAAGSEYSLFLKSDGSLWVMGYNGYGQLGDGTDNNTNLPKQIVASNITAIAAGSEYSLFLKSDGSLWAMGENDGGQLGDGTYNANGVYFPEQIVASNITAIAAGSEDSLFLKSDGSLWAMGANIHGELGDGTDNYDVPVPEQIVASNVTAIAEGDEYSLFLKSDGSLWAMGANNIGQLGDGTDGPPPTFATNLPEQIVASNVTAIAAGSSHSLFLKSDGSLWATGGNLFGQLGDGTYGAYPTFSTNRPEQIVSSGVTAIAAGLYYSLFLKSDGSLWAMGYNQFGQLGDGTYGSADFPYGTNRPEQILAAYNQISGQLLNDTNMQLSFVGVANANYALDRSASLSPPNWIPQTTNPAGSFGALIFTNPPDATTNNFWRIRSVP